MVDKTKTSSEEMERRIGFVPELRVEGEGQEAKIVGYAAVFNSVTLIRTPWGNFREKIAPGAFKKALETSDVRGLFNHDRNQVLGRAKSGTMTLKEDDKGLRYEITPPDAQWAKDLLVTMRRGDVDQSSFGFRVIQGGDRWDEEDDGVDIRTILEVAELYDVGPVTFAAYQDTEAGVRSFEERLKVKSPPRVDWRLQDNLRAKQLELLKRQ